jgi:L-histidine Nalpha-methyltransferase
LFKVEILQSQMKIFSHEGEFASTVNAGLSLKDKCLPSWLIFDNTGSKIFKKITELDEYLPAKCEFEVIRNHKNLISELITEKKFNLIELGAGDGCKTKILIEHFLNKKLSFNYFPIDISNGAITNLVSSLENSYRDTSLQVTGLIGDYFEGLKTINQNESKQKLILFLGVTLNNLDLDKTRSFLKNLKGLLDPKDFLLTGFDLMKKPKLLYSAYNNALFEEFNLHLLDRINQELGANFNKKNFTQQAQYNPNTRAVESYLYSTQSQTVSIKALNKDFHFNAWEAMQTEQSFKYTLKEIEDLAAENGFEVVEQLLDPKKYFLDSVWRVSS